MPTSRERHRQQKLSSRNERTVRLGKDEGLENVLERLVQRMTFTDWEPTVNESPSKYTVSGISYPKSLLASSYRFPSSERRTRGAVDKVARRSRHRARRRRRRPVAVRSLQRLPAWRSISRRNAAYMRRIGVFGGAWSGGRQLSVCAVAKFVLFARPSATKAPVVGEDVRPLQAPRCKLREPFPEAACRPPAEPIADLRVVGDPPIGVPPSSRHRSPTRTRVDGEDVAGDLGCLSDGRLDPGPMS